MANLTPTEKLKQAEDKLHELYMGESVVRFVGNDGETVEYTRASIPRLEQYISRLKSEVTGIPTHSGPAQVLY